MTTTEDLRPPGRPPDASLSAPASASAQGRSPEADEADEEGRRFSTPTRKEKKNPGEADGAVLLTSSASSAFEWFQALLDVVGSEPQGAELRQCPAHRDSTPSLSVRGGDGRLLVHCFAGCDLDAILAALRLSHRHLLGVSPYRPAEHAAIFRLRLPIPPLSRGGTGAGHGMRLVAVHDYGDMFRLLRWRHPASGAKELGWERRDPAGAWLPGLGGMPLASLPLYREDEVRMAVAAVEPVVVVESESSVDALVHAGIYATTWAGGAANPNLVRLSHVLAGAQVIVIPDGDDPGRACAERIVDALTGVVGAWKCCGDEGEGHEAADLLAARGAAALRGAARRYVGVNVNLRP